jgi:hypothetical protein
MSIMKSIRSLLLASFALLGGGGSAQSIEDSGKINLSVVIPENVDGLNASQLSKLEAKIIQIVATSGIAASGYNQNFVIYPKFAVYESQVVEGGMQNITVVRAELSLFVKQVSNNLLFSSVSKPLKGSGKTQELAITNAIYSLPVVDAAFKTFLETGKQRIVQYYEANCSSIQKKADTYIQTKQYEEAVALLMSVPEEVSGCYGAVLDKAIDAYKAYQKQRCSEQIQQAKAASASKDYIAALNILANVDPSSSCNNEAQSLIKSIETKIDAEEKKQWDLQMKMYDDALNAEQQRLNAMKEIAVSYYKSQPTNLNYNYLVK